MITEKMLCGKKKIRLQKAYHAFWSFCMNCYNRYGIDDINLLQEMIAVQFDNLVIGIKRAYEIED